MIEDPVDINSIGWTTLLEKNVQKLIFYFSANKKTLSLQFVINADYPIPDVRKVFSITTVAGFRTPFNIGTRYVDKEEFLDYLKENYPDHLNWFLFHQEWLC